MAHESALDRVRCHETKQGESQIPFVLCLWRGLAVSAVLKLGIVVALWFQAFPHSILYTNLFFMPATPIWQSEAATNGIASRKKNQTTTLLVGLLTLAFLLRLGNAFYRFLNADEALHYLLSVQSSLAATYKASLTTVHPPLLIVFLHYWGMIGHSEFFLRLPSVLAGILGCGVIFCWLRRVTDYSTALIGFVLLLFSPALIQVSSEVRQYAFLLLFCASCLYFFDRAIEEDSVLTMLFSAVPLYLALLTHYSSLMFALTLGFYALLRLAGVPARARLWTAWSAGQVGAVTLIAFLFLTHISKLRKMNAMEGLVGTYLRRSVPLPGENDIAFIARSSLRLFHYFFSQGAVGAAGLIVFIVGIGLLVGDHGSADTDRRPAHRQLAFLFVFPLVLNCSLALFRLYPYGGTRHSSYLAIFTVPAIAMALARWHPNRRWWKPAVVVIVLVICNLFPSPQGEYIRLREQSRTRMAEAVESLRSLPAGSIILTDDQGALLLSYYLCGSNKVAQIEQAWFQPLFQAPCGVASVISIDPNRWTFKPETLPATLAAVRSTFHLSSDLPLWFFQAGWFIDKEFPLREELKQFGCSAPQRFGANIFVCQINLP
jgi:hypothetical protein